MFELNLLRTRLVAQKKYFMFLRIMLVFYAAMAVLFVFLFGKFVTGKVRIAIAEKRIAAYEQDIKQKDAEYNISALREKWEKIFRDMALIQNALENRDRQADRMREISALLPLGIWIRQMEISPAEVFLSLTVAPVGRQEYDILNEYIGRLEQSPLFGKGVKITTRSKQEFRGSQVEDYQIVVPVGQGQ